MAIAEAMARGSIEIKNQNNEYKVVYKYILVLPHVHSTFAVCTCFFVGMENLTLCKDDLFLQIHH